MDLQAVLPGSEVLWSNSGHAQCRWEVACSPKPSARPSAQLSPKGWPLSVGTPSEHAPSDSADSEDEDEHFRKAWVAARAFRSGTNLDS
jgi:hypothetical protein